MIKFINAVLAVVAGVGGGLALFWVLNFLVDRLPKRTAERIKPYAFILPAYAAISLFLIYPAIRTIIVSFANAQSTASPSGWQ